MELEGLKAKFIKRHILFMQHFSTMNIAGPLEQHPSTVSYK